MKTLSLLLIGIISLYSCSEPQKEASPKKEKVENDKGSIEYEVGTIPKDTSDQVWVFYHEVSDEINAVMNTQDLFYTLLYEGESSPMNCDSLVKVIHTSISKIKKMHHPGNEPEVYSKWTIELMLDFVKVLEAFKKKEYLMNTKPKEQWTSAELKWYESFMETRLDDHTERWFKWRDNAGNNYIKANEEYVGKQ